MLARLLIQNVALIDKIEIEFGQGLNILTGETGAGKSIVIDAITAVIGGRISKDIIRSGEDRAVIEALFIINNENKIKKLVEDGFEIDDNSVLLVRELYANGKNVCRVNGRMVTVSMLKLVGEELIDIHGQNENQSLLEANKHIDFLDDFIGQEIYNVKNEYLDKLDLFKELIAELGELSGSPDEIARKTDVLKFQIEEIASANLKDGEEGELNEQRLKLANSEKININLSNSYESLAGNGINGYSVLSLLNNSLRDLRQISEYDEKYSHASNSLTDIAYNLEEISRDIRIWRDEIESNPEKLAHIEERLDIISKLKRKYGKNVNDIIGYNQILQDELESYSNIEERFNQLNEKIGLLNKELYDIAIRISNIRKEKANILSENIVYELKDLEMKNTRFIVKIDFNDSLDADGLYKFDKNGLDNVEFYISPNLGEELKPLRKIASGGEMSRIMLAIKTILAKVDNKSTLIFDEIDSGISGKAAYSVAEKLAYISKDHQVICVTHLAQIASMADSHYVIEKRVHLDKTKTSLRLIPEEERDEEIAKIAGTSNITETTLMHAREILDTSAKAKESIRKESSC
ncbi:MAG: DNA repair protein RecN [Ignavibacteriales bacterium]